MEYLKNQKSSNDDSRIDFSSCLKGDVESLQKEIYDIKVDILSKRRFFTRLQPKTDYFLDKLGSTYISNYVPNLNYVEAPITTCSYMFPQWNQMPRGSSWHG